MRLIVKLLVRDVYHGKSRSYVTGLDRENGGDVKFSLPNESCPDFPIMVPLDVEADIKGRVFERNVDLQVLKMSVEAGA